MEITSTELAEILGIDPPSRIKRRVRELLGYSGADYQSGYARTIPLETDGFGIYLFDDIVQRFKITVPEAINICSSILAWMGDPGLFPVSRKTLHSPDWEVGSWTIRLFWILPPENIWVLCPKVRISYKGKQTKIGNIDGIIVHETRFEPFPFRIDRSAPLDYPKFRHHAFHWTDSVLEKPVMNFLFRRYVKKMESGDPSIDLIGEIPVGKLLEIFIRNALDAGYLKEE